MASVIGPPKKRPSLGETTNIDVYADLKVFDADTYQFWVQNEHSVLNKTLSSDWIFRVEKSLFARHTRALLAISTVDYDTINPGDDVPSVIWQLVSWEAGKATILASKVPTAADYLMLTESQLESLPHLDAEVTKIGERKRAQEYTTSVQSLEKGFCLRCALLADETTSLSDSLTVTLELVISSAAESLSTNRLLELFLKHRISGEPNANYHFSPAPLYHPVRLQSFQHREVALRPNGLAEMTKSFNHQLRALNWMLSREDGSLGAHTHLEACQHELESLWIPITEEYSYSPWLELISNNLTKSSHLAFSEPRGGILADEMGMGKTVEVISLILSRRYASNTENTELSSLAIPKIHDSDDQQLLRCYCLLHDPKMAKTLRESKLVECPFCLHLQHACCVSYDPDQPDPYYACPECGSQGHMQSMVPGGETKPTLRKPVDCGATLIVCPESILPQWSAELSRHVSAGILRVAIFTGDTPRDVDFSLPVLCRSEQFRHYDVILATYHVLSAALQRDVAAEGQKLRNRRKSQEIRYSVMPSPLVGVLWYRVCFDESQMLGEGMSKAATLALHLKVRHRWAVSGTPISKSVRDLYGLMLFLNMSPYIDRPLWQKAIEKPLMEGRHTEKIERILISILLRVMWRTEKCDAAEELHMPGICDSTHVVQFTEVEKYMYQRRWQYCEEKLLKAKAKQSKGKLLPEDVTKMVSNLVTLRLACCHPQLGQQTGLKRLADGIMSAPAVFKQLIHQARIQAEERQRTRVFYLHGLAALAMAQKDYVTASNLYRQVLDPGEFDLHTDYSTLLHARYNLIEASKNLLAKKKHFTDAQRAELQAEMVQWQEKIDEYQNRYIAEAKHRLLVATTNYLSNLQELSPTAILQEEEQQEAMEQAKKNVKRQAEANKAMLKEAQPDGQLHDSTDAENSYSMDIATNITKLDSNQAENGKNASVIDHPPSPSATSPTIGTDPHSKLDVSSDLRGEEGTEKSSENLSSQSAEPDTPVPLFRSKSSKPKMEQSVRLKVDKGPIGHFGFLFDSDPLHLRISPLHWIHGRDSWWRVALQTISEPLLEELTKRLEQSFGKTVDKSVFESRFSLTKYLEKCLADLDQTFIKISDALKVMCSGKTLEEISVDVPPPDILARVKRESCLRCQSRKLSGDQKKRKYDRMDAAAFEVKGKDKDYCIWCLVQNQKDHLNELLFHYRHNGFVSILATIHQFVTDPDTFLESDEPEFDVLQSWKTEVHPVVLPKRGASSLAAPKRHGSDPNSTSNAHSMDLDQPTPENGNPPIMQNDISIEQHFPYEMPFRGPKYEINQLVRYHLTKDVGKMISVAARAYLRAIEVLKRRVKVLDRLCDAHYDYSSYGEELKMMVTRMRMHSEEHENDGPRYAQTLFHEFEIPALRAEYEQGLTSAQFELQEQCSQLRYLTKQADENLTTTCPICWEELPSQVVLLPCGHSGCPECFQTALKTSPKCPLCRAKVNMRNQEDLKIVSRDLPDVPIQEAPKEHLTNWGSKIEAIVNLVRNEMVKFPEEKFLIFSHWAPALALISSALKEAQISVINAAGEKFADGLDRFRQDPSIAVLCLPLSRGSKGANLMCASHIIFAEPSLLSASEAQAIGRIHRLGQNKEMKIHRFYVAGSVEQSIYELSTRRKSEKKSTADVGFGTQEKESNFLDLEILESILRGKLKWKMDEEGEEAVAHHMDLTNISSSMDF